jgi:hypothetical protein
VVRDEKIQNERLGPPPPLHHLSTFFQAPSPSLHPVTRFHYMPSLVIPPLLHPQRTTHSTPHKNLPYALRAYWGAYPSNTLTGLTLNLPQGPLLNHSANSSVSSAGLRPRIVPRYRVSLPLSQVPGLAVDEGTTAVALVPVARPEEGPGTPGPEGRVGTVAFRFAGTVSRMWHWVMEGTKKEPAQLGCRGEGKVSVASVFTCVGLLGMGWSRRRGKAEEERKNGEEGRTVSWHAPQQL